MTTSDYIASVGRIIQSYESQDSGNRAYVVERQDRRRWIKVLNLEMTPISELSRLVEFYNSIDHPLIPRGWISADLEDATVLECDWVPGRVLRSPDENRTDPDSAYQAFRRLPVSTRSAVFEQILDLFVHIQERGLIVEDFYDGCLIYDFDRNDLHVCDLDHIHPGPYRLDRPRQFGSRRFMAPEEFVQGSLIDFRTNTYNLGATGFVLIAGNRRDAHAWPLDHAGWELLNAATSQDPAARPADPRTLKEKWLSLTTQ